MPLNFRERKDRYEFPRNFSKTAGVSNLLNPGSIAELHQKLYSLMPVWLEGVQLSFRKNLSTSNAVTFTSKLSHVSPSGFLFGFSHYAKVNNDVLKSPFFKVDVNPSSLSLELVCLHHLTRSICFKADVQTGSYPYDLENGRNFFALDFISKDSTSSICLHNLTRDSGRLSLEVFKTGGPRISYGSVLLFEFLHDNLYVDLAFAARYSKDAWSLATSIGKNSIDMSAWFNMIKGQQLCTTIAINDRLSKALSSICYRWEKSDVIIKTYFDSDWSLGFNYIRKIKNLESSLCLSLLFNIPNNKFVCGFKIDCDSNLK